MKISLVIPMYNESSIISETAKTLSEYMSSNFKDYEIIFSDDGSKDGCGDIVRALKLPNVKVIGYENNQGKGCAVRHGVLAANGDFIMFTDADLAYGTNIIKEYVNFYNEESLKEDLHMIIGSRNLHKDGYSEYTLLRKIASKTYIKILCIVGGFKLSDSQCGCKAFRGDIAKAVFEKCKVNGFAFDFETILRVDGNGYTIKEYPVKIINHRQSKVNVFKDTFKMLRDLLKIKKMIKKEQSNRA